ncbi:MAG: hypothetical protein OEY14_04055 [Myxococcales bacterium]|nr:hypothetical protein [Myxococcales bacterium]
MLVLRDSLARPYLMGALVAGLLFGALGSSAAAQEMEESSGGSPFLNEEQDAARYRSQSSPYEDPRSEYLFLGAFYRHSFVPHFMLGIFLDDTTAANNSQLGLELTFRSDGFDIVTSLYYAGFSAYGPFRATGDPATDVEMIDSSLWALMGGATFLWSTAFNDVVAFEYGLGIGLGAIFGELRRTEAFPSTNEGAPGYAYGFEPCSGVGVPNPAYCDGPSAADGEYGGHYDVRARSWLDGGSVPVIWVRMALPHLALRIKPVKQFMMRIDGGFDIFSGFFVGLSLNYGFEPSEG